MFDSQEVSGLVSKSPKRPFCGGQTDKFFFSVKKKLIVECFRVKFIGDYYAVAVIP